MPIFSKSDGILRSPFPDVEIPDTDICSVMFPVFRKWGDLVAMECAESGRSYTYNQLVDLSMKWCGALQQMTSGQKYPFVACISPNVPEYAIITYGCLAAGFALVALDDSLSVETITSQLMDIDVAVIVADPNLEHVVTEVLANLPRKVEAVFNGQTKGGYSNLIDIINDPSTPTGRREKIEPSKAAVVVFSSGTTGKSKGIVDNHKGILSFLLTVNANEDLQLFAKTTETQQESIIATGPLWSGYFFSMNLVIGPYAGVKALTFRSYDVQGYISAVKRHKLRILHLTASLLNTLGKNPLVKEEDLLGAKVILCTGAKFHHSTYKALKLKAPHIFFREMYGASEIKGVSMTPSDEEKPGFSGKLLPNNVAKIVDMGTGCVLGPEKEGELYIRGTGIMSHYHNNQAATSEVLDKDGWFHTGDVAYYTTDGWICIVDRIKDMLKVYTELHHYKLVYPSRIEQILMKHPAVADAGVTGVFNEKTIEAPKAFVVLKAEATEEELYKFVSGQVEDHERLRGGISFAQQLPRNPSGKLLRRFLKDLK